MKIIHTKEIKQGAYKFVKNIKRKPFIGVIIILLILIPFILVKGYKVSRRSYICPKCHYMEAYYEKWQTSTHNKIECIKCHKLGLGKQIGFALKYLTGMYSPRAHSIIDDDSCLQQGCHNMAVLKKELKYGNFVRFNHPIHLSNNVRGIKLKCSSCHSQIVQGAHIAVSKDTCFLCHFYRLPQSAPLMGCPSCHYPPKKKLLLANYEFDHKPYLRIKVSCSQCHTKIIEGTGNVSIEKCSICHVKPEINFADAIHIHNRHVSYLNNNCFTCHGIIRHGKFEMSQVIKPDCSKCHQNKHNYAELIYMGTGIEGIRDYPSKMFLSRVSCEGCHPSNASLIFKQETNKENYKQRCSSCHEKKYSSLIDDWLNISKVIYDSLESLVNKKNSVDKGRNEARKIKEFLINGKIIHNPLYSYSLMRRIIELEKYPSKQEDNLTIAINKSCKSFCHPVLNINKISKLKTEEFPHNFHEERVGCLTCHSSTEHPKTKETAFNCMECHHNLAKKVNCDNCHKLQRKMLQGNLFKEIQQKENPMAELECSQCHSSFEKDKIISDVKKNCLNCHDKGYEELVDQWQDEWNENISSLGLMIWIKEKEILSTSKCLANLQKIKSIYETLIKAKGSHNIYYAIDAINYLKNEINTLKHCQ